MIWFCSKSSFITWVFQRTHIRPLNIVLFYDSLHNCEKSTKTITAFFSFVDNFVYNATKGFYCFRPPGSSLAQCLDKNKGRQHPKMKPDTRRKLYEYFRPKNKEFFRKIGEEFDWDITLDD